MLNEPARTLFRADALARWHAAATPIAIAELLADITTLGVIVPHPDDETLGCGGLIAAAAEHGIAVTVTILTDGAASHPGSTLWPPDRIARCRQVEAVNAVATLTDGAGRVVFAGAADGRLAKHPTAGDVVPEADFYVTCWRGDPHVDHVAAFAIATRVANRFAKPLLAFPLWVLTTDCPVPDETILRIGVMPHLQTKRTALAAHGSQLRFPETGVAGFVLDAELQQLFVRSDELYVRMR